jgi:hypothetical protein
LLPDGNIRVDISPTLADMSDDHFGVTAAPVNAGAWVHLAFVYDGAQSTGAERLQIFVDGVSRALAFSAGGIPGALTSGAAPVSIGLGADSTGGFSGLLDDVRVYGRALGDEEIRTLGSYCAGTSSGLIPIDNLGTGIYQGRQGGLYPGGSNVRPAAHDAALADVGAPVPLDAAGDLDPVNGRIGFISCGMSNATQEFSAFMTLAGAYPDLNPQLVIVDCAVPGKTAEIIQNPGDNYWTICDDRVAAAGLTNAQVEVVWLKEADGFVLSPWPEYPEKLRDEMGGILQILRTRYPNTRSAYLSSRTYGGYATTMLSPEPYAYESGFAVKWLIEEQLAGDPRYNFDPAMGAVNAPWIAWGPYLWADGLTPRGDGFFWECEDFNPNDGTHPSPSGQNKVANLLLDFFRSDPTTIPWFLSCTDTAPGEVQVLKLSRQAAAIELSWSSLDPTAGAATVYDIVSGSIASLSPSGGFLDGSCLAADVPDTPHTDDSASAPGSAVWYRVRARNSCGAGPWGDAALDGGAIHCP